MFELLESQKAPSVAPQEVLSFATPVGEVDVVVGRRAPWLVELQRLKRGEPRPNKSANLRPSMGLA